MCLIIGMGLAAVSYSLIKLPFSGERYQWIIMAALTIPACYFSVKIPAINSRIAFGDALFFTNLVLFGIPAGTITAALEALMGSIRGRNRSHGLLNVLFNVSAMACSSHLSGMIFFAMLRRGPVLEPPYPSPSALLIPMSILALAQYILNSGSVAIIVALEKRKNIYVIWKESFLWTCVTYFAGAAAAGIIAISVGPNTPQVVGIVSLALMALLLSYKTYLDKVEEVHSLAYYDSLTTLPNRILFREHLEQALVVSERDEQMLAVMFLDLDNFKRINDTYGHGVGDLLIKGVAERLRLCLRTKTREAGNRVIEPDIVIGRFGGDEFNLLMRQLRSPQNATRVAQRILEAFAAPFMLDKYEVSVTPSIGISIYPYDGKDTETLLKNADVAMFHAKSQGKSSYHCYSQFMNATTSNRLSLENDLRKALERGEFCLYYQPKIDTHSNLLTGAEALIRWNHPHRGILPASEFISLAEETGLIKPIGDWVLRTACEQLADWKGQGLLLIPVAINLSSIQFRQKDLCQKIAEALKQTALNPAYLELEITESTIMENEEAAGNSLLELQDLGVKISIDDFGTGYSSLSRLKSFTLDTLKIDRSFVMDLPSSQDDRAITTAIIVMAHSLGLKVIAEGVETELQLEFLKKLGCDQIQGYLFSKPLPAEEFAVLITQVHPALAMMHPVVSAHSRFWAGGQILAPSLIGLENRRGERRMRAIAAR